VLLARVRVLRSTCTLSLQALAVSGSHGRRPACQQPSRCRRGECSASSTHTRPFSIARDRAATSEERGESWLSRKQPSRDARLSTSCCSLRSHVVHVILQRHHDLNWSKHVHETTHTAAHQLVVRKCASRLLLVLLPVVLAECSTLLRVADNMSCTSLCTMHAMTAV
jgi:hypothetical protein